LDNAISVGQNRDARFAAFGDDSQYGDVLVYAFIIVKRSRVTSMERRLRVLKEKFAIPDDTNIHCRVLFSGQQRNKAELSHLGPGDAEKVVSQIVTIINQTPAVVRYAVGSLKEFRDEMGTKIVMQNRDGENTMALPVDANPKGLLGLLMQSCFAVPPDGSQGPPPSECHIVTSADSTKTRFVGVDKKRADRMYSGYSAIGAPTGTPFKVEPQVGAESDHPLLQIADVAAYICSHAEAEDEAPSFHARQARRFRYWSRSRSRFGAN